jgi:elongation factor 1-alpha
MHKIDCEKYYGNIEYKQELSNMDSDKIQKYATQMKFRLIEGNGEAVYLIGVQDDGNIIGVPNKLLKSYTRIIKDICQEINSKISDISYIKLPQIKHSIMMVRIIANFELKSIFYLTGDDI